MPSSACDWSSDVCSSDRSEEHTSELQSRSDLVCRLLSSEEHTSEVQSRSDIECRLLLEKKKPELQSLAYIVCRLLLDKIDRLDSPTHGAARRSGVRHG